MTKTTWPLAAALALALSGPALADQVGYQAGAGNPNTVAVSPQTPLPVTITPTASSTAASVDASGVVASANIYQQVFAASTTRKGCAIQNPTTAIETLNVRVGTTTVFNLPPGALFRCGGSVVINDAIFVTAATATHAFSADSQ